MSKLCLMGKNALALRTRVSTPNPSRFLLLSSLRSFSTAEGEWQPQQKQQASHFSSSSADPLHQHPQGAVFGRCNVITRNMLKTDIIHFFEGCNLSPADVKFEYNKAYAPVGMCLRFPSQPDFDSAVRQTVRKGRLYNINRTDHIQWELLQSYDGKAVLLQGLPREVNANDIQRFLSGYNYDANYQMFVRPVGPNEVMRCTIIQFPTSIDAMSAFLMKNNSFCLNSPVTMRVLQ